MTTALSIPTAEPTALIQEAMTQAVMAHWEPTARKLIRAYLAAGWEPRSIPPVMPDALSKLMAKATSVYVLGALKYLDADGARLSFGAIPGIVTESMPGVIDSLMGAIPAPVDKDLAPTNALNDHVDEVGLPRAVEQLVLLTLEELAPEIARLKALEDRAYGTPPAMDMAPIVRAIRETPIKVEVTVNPSPPGDAVIMRDEEGQVVGVRRYPYEPEPAPIPTPTAQDDANDSAAAVSAISGIPVTPVATSPGSAAPRGVIPGSKAARMRELAKSGDPETRSTARAWLRKRHIPEE